MSRRNLKFAKELRSNQTDAEARLWRHLRGRHFENFKFRRQVPLGPYIVDFICFEANVVIELDGGQHALQVDADSERTAWLASQGFRVLRFWNHDVLTNVESVLEEIWPRLKNPPHPSPLPPGERE